LEHIVVRQEDWEGLFLVIQYAPLLQWIDIWLLLGLVLDMQQQNECTRRKSHLPLVLPKPRLLLVKQAEIQCIGEKDPVRHKARPYDRLTSAANR